MKIQQSKSRSFQTVLNRTATNITIMPGCEWIAYDSEPEDDPDNYEEYSEE